MTKVVRGVKGSGLTIEVRVLDISVLRYMAGILRRGSLLSRWKKLRERRSCWLWRTEASLYCYIGNDWITWLSRYQRETGWFRTSRWLRGRPFKRKMASTLEEPCMFGIYLENLARKLWRSCMWFMKFTKYFPGSSQALFMSEIIDAVNTPSLPLCFSMSLDQASKGKFVLYHWPSYCWPHWWSFE